MDPDSMPRTLAEQLAEAAKRLEQVTETPRLDAELLLAHSLGISRSKLLIQLQTRLNVDGFGEVLERFMGLPAEIVNRLMTNDEIIRCSNCTRILILKESEE